MSAIVSRPILAEAVERALIGGDLSALNVTQKLSLYKAVCESVGLNPLTKPFDLIRFQGKEILYANKNCAEQLRNQHRISVYKLERDSPGDTFDITAYGRNGDGREDSGFASVVITGLKGEALANAKMKCETKAKRRLTLSMCGLGMLDETEVATIPGAVKMPMLPLEEAVEDESQEVDDAEPKIDIYGDVEEPSPKPNPNVRFWETMDRERLRVGPEAYFELLSRYKDEKGNPYEDCFSIKDREVQLQVWEALKRLPTKEEE